MLSRLESPFEGEKQYFKEEERCHERSAVLFPDVYGTLPIVITIKNNPDQFMQRPPAVLVLNVSGKKMNVALDTTINHSSVVKRDDGFIITQEPFP